MELLFIILYIYIGSIISKFIFLNVYQGENKAYLFKDKKEFWIFLLVPIASLRFVKSKVFTKPKAENDFKKLNLFCEILGIFCYICLGIYTFNLFNGINTQTIDLIFSFLFFTLLTNSLLYLAIFDTFTFSIPAHFTKGLLMFVILANLFVGLVKLLSGYFSKSIIFGSVGLGNIDNLIAGLALGLLIWGIIKATKEKGMGEGDIDMMAIIGFALGWPWAIVSFFSTLIVGSGLSLIYAAYVKKFKGLMIPFVPFILLGFCITLAFGSQIWRLIYGF